MAGASGRWPAACGRWVSGGRCPVAGGMWGGQWPVAGTAEFRFGDTTTMCTTTTTKTTTKTSPTRNIVAWARLPWSSNMNIIIVWAWMCWSSDAVKHGRCYDLGMDVWSSDAVEHERDDGFGMDALVIGCSQTRTSLWFGHGCFGHRMQSGVNAMMVWAWTFWSSDAVEREHYYGVSAREYTSGCCVIPPVTTTT